MSAITNSIARTVRSTPSVRSFSIAARRMAGGDTGATRSGGAAQGDAFTKREKANEDLFVREQEKHKLEQLKKKIQDQESALEKDRAEAEKLSGKK
ncbi:related to H+-transporting ATP synthase inhibitor precursor, mitochondrial [Ramularia collo-cygni]|uniref:ATPase inhibitor, mitochondrial n=1 Tax=Ramularia collo-cygni TaxID=112498 RepID=A0A2D3UM21_9PEZI|nr:related to H+-transporting ATP synthase inhibitor precursor, mitochondrial [Ramularia collo-cygni]CZT14661.1 related to H+-transporting ATP synthase inhibitor precursor, mitochondrial [Ramularia collo-cygni]